MNITHLPPIPDDAYAKGVSAPFCGFIGPVAIVAGGANFPDKPLLEGGAKRVYNDIWAHDGKEWARIGYLPDSVAYGATFPVPEGLVLAGGQVDGKPSDRVYLLRLGGDPSAALGMTGGEGLGMTRSVAAIDTLPSLPVPMAEAGWTHTADRLFLAGNGKVYSCVTGEYEWEFVAEMPEPLVQPVLYAHGSDLYLWGGFNPETKDVSPRGWKLSMGQIIEGNNDLPWLPAPEIPDGGTFVGATGAVMPDGKLIVVGGVNREIFARALHNTPEDRIPYLSKAPEEYRFRTAVYVFDGTSWTKKADIKDCALAGPGVAVDSKGTILVSGGEIKPGVRSPKSFLLK